MIRKKYIEEFDEQAEVNSINAGYKSAWEWEHKDFNSFWKMLINMEKEYEKKP